RGLLDREGFGVAGAALHSADAHQTEARFVAKPSPPGYGRIALPEQPRLLMRRGDWNRQVEGRIGQSRLPREDLVAEYRVVAKLSGNQVSQRHHVGSPAGPKFHAIDRWSACATSRRHAKTEARPRTRPKLPIVILWSIHTFW